MTLTPEQFSKAREKYSVQQIAEFEKKRIGGGVVDYKDQTSSQVQQQKPIEQEKPSALSSIIRGIFRSSGLEQLKTSQFLQDKMPQPSPGESFREYRKRVSDILKPREEDIARKGTLSQLEAPMMGAGALATGGGNIAVGKLLKSGAAFIGVNKITEAMGLGKAIENIDSPTIRDISEIGRFAVEGGLATKIGGFGVIKKTSQTIKGAEKIAIKHLGEKKTSILKQAAIEEKAAKLTRIHQNNLKKLSKAIDSTAENIATKGKQIYSDFNRAFSENYKNMLDDIAKLPEVLNNIKANNLNDFGKNLINKLETNPSYKESNAIKAVKSFFKQFGSKKTSLVDASGKPVSLKQTQNIGFQEFNAKIKGLLSQRRFGKDLNTVDDVVLDEVRSEYMKFIGNYTNKFANLQKMASEQLNSKVIAAKVLKPNSEVDVEKVVGLLKRNSIGKSKPGDELVISKLEDILGKGFNKDIKIIGNKIQVNQRAADRIKQVAKSSIRNIKTQRQVSSIEAQENIKKIKAGLPSKRVKGKIAEGFDFVAKETFRAIIYKMLFRGILR